MYSFTHALGVALSAQKIQLLGETAYGGGKGKELFGETFAEATEFGIILILWVVAPAKCGRLMIALAQMYNMAGVTNLAF